MLHRNRLLGVVILTVTATSAAAQEATPQPSAAETELTSLCKLIKEQPGSASEQQVVEAITKAGELNRPFLAEQALRVYLASQSNPSQAVRLQAIESALRVGDYNAAMVRCKRYLDSAKPGPEASRVAAMLYWIQIDNLNLVDDAYRTMGSQMDKLCTGAAARKYDAWYLRQTAERRDYANLARRLAEVHAVGLPVAQTQYFYAGYVDLLLSVTMKPSEENLAAADHLAQLARIIKDDERIKQRCALYAANLKFAATADGQPPVDRAQQYAPVIAAANTYVAKVPTAEALYDIMWVLGGSDSGQFGTQFSDEYQGQLKRDFFVSAFGKLPVPEQQALLAKSSFHAFASSEQWTELTAKYPRAFHRNHGISLKYATVADCKRLVPGVQHSTEHHAMVVRAVSSGRDFTGCIDQLVAQDAWHQGGFDNFYHFIRNQLRNSYQAAHTAENKQLPPNWYEQAIVRYGAQHVAKTPLALGPGTASEYLQYVWSLQPDGMEAALDSFAWVPYSEAERKSVFDPVFGVFVKWADEARKRRQSGLENVATANRSAAAAAAALAKLKADGADQNQIKTAEQKLNAAKDQLAKANEQLKLADADVARIGPVEAAFKKVMQAKFGDPNRAPNPYCKHLAELIVARQKKNAGAFTAAGRKLYPLVKDYRARKIPLGKVVTANMLQAPHDLDVFDFQLEVLADQLKGFDPNSAASVADIQGLTAHIMASRMGWDFTRIPAADRDKALRMHGVIADALSAQIDRGRVPRWLFNALRGTRYGTGWDSKPEDFKRTEELVDKMIQRDVLAKDDFRYGGAFATTTYMWLVRNEARGLAEKYPVETFFDARFTQEATREGFIDDVYFSQGGQDKERKIHELAAKLTAQAQQLPIDARRREPCSQAQFQQTQSRGMGADAASRDAMLTKIESYYGKTRFDDVAMGRTRINLIGDMSDDQVRQDYFAKVSAYLDRAASSPVRAPAPNLLNLRSLQREQPLTDEEFAVIVRLYSPECGLTGTSGSGANEMIRRLLPEMVTDERRGQLFQLAPTLWKIAAYDNNFQKQLVDQIVTFQQQEQFDLAAALSGVGLEMFEGQVRDSEKNRLRVARAQSLLNIGGLAEVDPNDPRYSILAAQSDFLTGNLERAWQNYTAKHQPGR